MGCKYGFRRFLKKKNIYEFLKKKNIYETNFQKKNNRTKSIDKFSKTLLLIEHNDII